MQRAAHMEEQVPENAKFTFEFADVGKAEQGALNERLGLPPPYVAKAMQDEHASETEWTTGNYRLTTHPKQEYEFVDCPKEGKTYPGEGPGGRRRQLAEDVWRRLHSRLPVEEALKGFKSRLGRLDMNKMGRIVRKQLKEHTSESEKSERSVTELKHALVQALVRTEDVAINDTHGFVQSLDAQVVQAAAGGGWMSEGEKCKWVERQIATEVRELQERLAAWDLSLVEVKAVML